MAKPLSSREVEILTMQAKGSATREIADAFDIAERSARAHVQMIVEKLGVTDSVQAVQLQTLLKALGAV